MPPKAKITKEMILNTVLELTRETGFEAVNARSVAGKLSCSTRPIFTCYENMDDLKKEFLAFAYQYYKQFVRDFQKSESVSPCLIFPLSYLEFAEREPLLFQLLFIDDMDLEMTAAKDFYRELDNEKNAQIFAETIGIGYEQAKVVFLDLFLYTHGMAVLTATKKLTLDREHAKKMLEHILSAFVRQEQPDWTLPV